MVWMTCCHSALGFVIAYAQSESDITMSYLITPAMVTYDFVVGLSDITVTELGVFGCLQDGLAHNYDTIVWDSTGTPVASATVPQGVVEQFIDGFWYTPLDSPALLYAGGSYVIGTWYPEGGDGIGTPTSWDPAGTPHFSEFGANHACFESASLAFPGEFNGTGPLLGPSFQYDVVPEPSSYALMVCGLAVILLAKRREALGRTKA